MGNYYFLAASLPPLAFGEKPEIRFDQFRMAAEINLNKKDNEKMILLRRITDFENVRSLLLKFPLDDRGNLSEIELDEALLTQSVLPDYFFDFLSKHNQHDQLIRNFAEVFSLYFSEEIPKQKGFVARFLNFEREFRIVLAALRAKEYKRDVIGELQFEDFSDSIVSGVLAQKDMETYEPPIEYQEIKRYFSCDRKESFRKVSKDRRVSFSENRRAGSSSSFFYRLDFSLHVATDDG